MYIQLRPIGFVSAHRGPYAFLGIRFLRWHMALKPTRHELFSERYGYTRTWRFLGLSLTIRRVLENGPPDPAGRAALAREEG